jgi:hypothetical protein
MALYQRLFQDLPKTELWSGPMPTLVTATVLYWTVNRKAGAPPTVTLSDSSPIRWLVADGGNSADTTPIIAKYILDADKKNWPDLLAAARDGLLQITDIHRTPVTTPSVPPTDEQPAK